MNSADTVNPSRRSSGVSGLIDSGGAEVRSVHPAAFLGTDFTVSAAPVPDSDKGMARGMPRGTGLGRISSVVPLGEHLAQLDEGANREPPAEEGRFNRGESCNEPRDLRAPEDRGLREPGLPYARVGERRTPGRPARAACGPAISQPIGAGQGSSGPSRQTVPVDPWEPNPRLHHKMCGGSRRTAGAQTRRGEDAPARRQTACAHRGDAEQVMPLTTIAHGHVTAKAIPVYAEHSGPRESLFSNGRGRSRAGGKPC